MTISGPVLLTILGMAAVTYAARAAGLWLLGRLTLSRRLETGLRYIPGTVLISIIAPAVLDGGAAEKVAALATLLVAARSGNILLSMTVGVVMVWLGRHVL